MNHNMMSESQAEEKVSEMFCAADADLILRSCDGGIFKVHRRNLEMHAEGFAAAEAASISSSSENAETVTLTETTAVLEVLLQYMYRQPQPDLRNVEFKTLAGAAEAAEKYQVYSAAYVCKVFMELKVRQHPFDVLHYAAKHGYKSIANEAAKHTIGATVEDAAKALSPTNLIVWARYNDGWQKALQSAYQWPRTDAHVFDIWDTQPCDHWTKIYGIICQNLGGRPGALKNLHEIFLKGRIEKRCGLCDRDLQEWEKVITESMVEIAPFSTLV